MIEMTGTIEMLKKEKEKYSKMIEYFKEEPKMKVKKLERKYRLVISQSEGNLIKDALREYKTNPTLSAYTTKQIDSIHRDLQLGMDWKKGDKEDGKADA